MKQVVSAAPRRPDYALIKRLEHELLVNDCEHPYGFTPEGLTTEVRVEHERWLRENAPYGFPSCQQRLVDAEAGARRRWPEAFLTHPESAADVPERPICVGDCLGCRPYNCGQANR